MIFQPADSFFHLCNCFFCRKISPVRVKGNNTFVQRDRKFGGATVTELPVFVEADFFHTRPYKLIPKSKILRLSPIRDKERRGIDDYRSINASPVEKLKTHYRHHRQLRSLRIAR
jgi:hypothetical protein